jgi:putative hemolysin
MSGVWISIGVVLVLLVTGGLFTATEMALVSLRAGQLTAIGARGRRGERIARLAGEPTRYLAAVQIGAVVAGFFAAAYGAATLADPLARLIGDSANPDHSAEGIAVVIVTLLITYAALVLSELTPRRYAMQHAPGVALLLGSPLDRFATLLRPLIWFLSKSTNVMLRLLRSGTSGSSEQVSEEELRELVLTHEGLGEHERRILHDVFLARGGYVRQAMLPRGDVDFLDASLRVTDAAREAWVHAHTRYPVIDGSPDNVIGFVHVRDLLDPDLDGSDVQVRDLVRTAPAFPATKPLLAALAEMQQQAAQLALVIDEYGGLAGIVTLEDLVEELVGEIQDEYDVAPADLAVAGDAAIEFDGLAGLGEVSARSGIALPSGPYDTISGFVVTALGRMPEVGDAVEVDRHRITVTAVAGRRVQRLRVTPLDPDQPPSP